VAQSGKTRTWCKLYFRVSKKAYPRVSVLTNRVKRGYGLKEHQKAVSTLNRGKSALAEHVCDTKHGITWENSKVVPQTIIVPHKVVLWSKTMPRCVAYKYE
jgi:hypothetical protein